jgi:2-methylcitrate dehydratase PrpD
VAIALLHGEVTIDSFTNETRFHPDVEALLRRVVLKVDDAIPADFDRMHTIVTVTLKNRTQYSKRVAELSGWIGHPLTREERINKFNSCARRVIESRAAERVIDLVEQLDKLDNVGEIMNIVRADARR